MVRPSSFRTNVQTIENNYFQNLSKIGDKETLKKAQDEFDHLVKKIESFDIPVNVFQDDLTYDTPDSLFPNNWISFHKNNKIALYPMFAKNRRLERNENILKFLESNNVKIKSIFDYTIAEKNKQYLEGTGSMVFDRINKKVYASISERTSEILIDEFCEDFNYMPIVFKSYQSHDNARKLIYHTNVMMCIADKYSIICLDSIDCNIEKNKVSESLKDDGKEIIEISSRQLNSFAGNMIELVYNNQSYLVMSASAYESLSKEQIIKINKYSQIIFSDVSTIEYCGGGSVRCMIAEIFN